MMVIPIWMQFDLLIHLQDSQTETKANRKASKFDLLIHLQDSQTLAGGLRNFVSLIYLFTYKTLKPETSAQIQNAV